jgi:hypothetical protein
MGSLSMNSVIEEKRKKRFQFMNALYNQVEGQELQIVDMFELGEELGFSRDETDGTVEYLDGEGLLKYRATGGAIGITHAGVVEVEAALSQPERPTQHFPAFNVINIQNMVNSQIQQATAHSTQSGSFTTTQTSELAEFLKELKSKLPQLNLDETEKADVEAEIATTEAQLKSSKPKSAILSTSLGAIKEIVMRVGTIGAAQEILQQIHKLHWLHL